MYLTPMVKTGWNKWVKRGACLVKQSPKPPARDKRTKKISGLTLRLIRGYFSFEFSIRSFLFFSLFALLFGWREIEGKRWRRKLQVMGSASYSFLGCGIPLQVMVSASYSFLGYGVPLTSTFRPTFLSKNTVAISRFVAKKVWGKKLISETIEKKSRTFLRDLGVVVW